jgi:hypothetical protein
VNGDFGGSAFRGQLLRQRLLAVIHHLSAPRSNYKGARKNKFALKDAAPTIGMGRDAPLKKSTTKRKSTAQQKCTAKHCTFT